MEKFDAADLRWEERTEQIWVVSQSTYGILGASTHEMSAHKIPEIVGDTTRLPVTVQGVMLHRPSLAPIYGGPTLLEALWNEMDSIMERLMTGAVSEDGQDVGRAQSIAWVIAISTNPYNPSIDRVRAEAMERWNVSQAE